MAAGGKADADDPQALRRRYDAVIGTITDGVYGTDASGNILFANPAAARILGYRVDEMIGKNAHDLLHHTRVDGSPYPRDDCPEAASERDGTVHHVRGGEVFWKKDGKPVPVEFTTSPVRGQAGTGGVIVTFRGMAERERVEQALRESEERFRRLADATLEGILIHDRGAILDVNQALADMFGYEPQEVVGKQVLDFVDPSDRETVQAHIRSNIEGMYRAKGIRKDGSSIPLEVNGRAIPYRGRMVRVATFRDLTPRRDASGDGASSIERPLVRRIVQDLVEAGGVAHQMLQSVGRKLASEAPAESIEDFTRSYADMGLGDVRVEKREEGRVSFIGRELLEKRPGARIATCYFTLGFLSEAVSRVSHGEPTLGTEIECQSRGSHQCRFIVQVKKPEEGLARRVKELV